MEVEPADDGEDEGVGGGELQEAGGFFEGVAGFDGDGARDVGGLEDGGEVWGR